MFDLHITCTKDITFLKIDFADGTSVVGEKPKTDKPQKKVQHQSNFNENQKQTVENYDNMDTKKFKKVKLPEIKEKHRDAVKIADELQNLEI